MTEQIETTIKEIEADIQYFKNLEFNILASKFQRDLDALKQVLTAVTATAH